MRALIIASLASARRCACPRHGCCGRRWSQRLHHLLALAGHHRLLVGRRLRVPGVEPRRDAVRAGQRRRPLVDEPMAGPRDDDGLVVSGAVTQRSLTASHVSRAFARWASVT